MQDFKLRFSCDSPPALVDISSIVDIIDPCIDHHHNELLHSSLLKI